MKSLLPTGLVMGAILFLSASTDDLLNEACADEVSADSDAAQEHLPPPIVRRAPSQPAQARSVQGVSSPAVPRSRGAVVPPRPASSRATARRGLPVPRPPPPPSFTDRGRSTPRADRQPRPQAQPASSAGAATPTRAGASDPYWASSIGAPRNWAEPEKRWSEPLPNQAPQITPPTVPMPPVAPESAAPESAAPESAAPESAAPESAAPESAAPESTGLATPGPVAEEGPSRPAQEMRPSASPKDPRTWSHPVDPEEIRARAEAEKSLIVPFKTMPRAADPFWVSTITSPRPTTSVRVGPVRRTPGVGVVPRGSGRSDSGRGQAPYTRPQPRGRIWSRPMQAGSRQPLQPQGGLPVPPRPPPPPLR